MSPQVKGLELDLANDELVHVGMKRGNVDLHAILLQHMEKCGLSSIVQAKEQDFGILMIKTWGFILNHAQEKMRVVAKQ